MNEPKNVSLISLKSVKKVFKNGEGVYEVTFDIPKNKITGFIGNNGAGKTTTIKMILNEYQVESGEITINIGDEVNSTKDISFFPDQNNFPKHFNIIEFAQYSASLKFLDKKKTDIEIEKWVKILSLEKWQKNTFKQLSTGLQKRALLLAILVSEPKLIILDEPTANLDIDSRLEILTLLQKIHNELEIDILITSHNLEELENMIDYIVIINDGLIKFAGDFNKNNSKLKELYKEHVKNNKKIDLESISLK